ERTLISIGLFILRWPIFPSMAIIRRAFKGLSSGILNCRVLLTSLQRSLRLQKPGPCLLPYMLGGGLVSTERRRRDYVLPLVPVRGLSTSSATTGVLSMVRPLRTEAQPP